MSTAPAPVAAQLILPLIQSSVKFGGSPFGKSPDALLSRYLWQLFRHELINPPGVKMEIKV